MIRCNASSLRRSGNTMAIIRRFWCALPDAIPNHVLLLRRGARAPLFKR